MTQRIPVVMDESTLELMLSLELDDEHTLLEQEAFRAVHGKIATSFPKSCPMCKRIYTNEQDFVKSTDAVRPAMNHHDIGILLFERNCRSICSEASEGKTITPRCTTTLALGLDRAALGAFQTYCFYGTMRYLGEKFREEIDKLPSENPKKNQLVTLCLAFLKDGRETLHPTTEGKLADLQDNFQIGLNVFRERYNRWLEKISQTTDPDTEDDYDSGIVDLPNPYDCTE